MHCENLHPFLKFQVVQVWGEFGKMPDSKPRENIVKVLEAGHWGFPVLSSICVHVISTYPFFGRRPVRTSMAIGLLMMAGKIASKSLQK